AQPRGRGDLDEAAWPADGREGRAARAPPLAAGGLPGRDGGRHCQACLAAHQPETDARGVRLARRRDAQLRGPDERGQVTDGRPHKRAAVDVDHLRNMSRGVAAMLGCRFVALALLLAAGITPADEPRAGEWPPELSWSPAGSAGFRHVRLGQLVSSPAWPDIRDALNRDDPGAIERAERALGVHLNQIDRLTVLVPVATGNAPEDSIVLRVTT